MEYQDYDLLLKYQMYQDRQESVYYGNPTLYEDGRTLETFPEQNDMVNGKKPLFVFGTVVYLRYNGKILMLEQKKEDKVVDTLVGLGGKVRPMIGKIMQSQEKNEINGILQSYEDGLLDTAEDIRLAASREVMEETSTYKKDENGAYTHEIEKEGITINAEDLHRIGTSRIRLTLSNKTECWLIENFIYDLSEEEYQFIEQNVSKENREGVLQWLSLEEALSHMSTADKMILENSNENISVSEIRDQVNHHNIARYVLHRESNDSYGTMIDGSLVYTSDTSYHGTQSKI